ncbi:phage tail protein, partial [Shewanella algae]|uniref:phage tail-collar fiber domain-containing protein n=1 Tax=Shewanella algae TaxID=38313 RepID=UPI001F25341A
MATVITKAGEALMARKAQANEQLDIDTFIFANVPGQDPAAPIDRDEGVPPVAQLVHQQQVQQYGRISDNIVVYSTVLSSTTGPFEFNWLGLYSSVNQTLVAIQHVPTVTKTVTAPGVAGNTLNRNFGIEYSGIAELTGINVAPETWQLDFTARLAGMDELTRQLAADMNGRDWFIDDGFKVEPRSTLNSFRVLPGVGYVSGLRIELENEHIFNVQSYPQNVYVDAWFDGTAESVWRPNVAFTVSNTEMDDYIDVNGVQHYVFKLAVINDIEAVEDLRQDKGIAEKKWVEKRQSEWTQTRDLDSEQLHAKLGQRNGIKIAYLGDSIMAGVGAVNGAYGEANKEWVTFPSLLSASLMFADPGFFLVNDIVAGGNGVIHYHLAGTNKLPYVKLELGQGEAELEVRANDAVKEFPDLTIYHYASSRDEYTDFQVSIYDGGELVKTETIKASLERFRIDGVVDIDVEPQVKSHTVSLGRLVSNFYKVVITNPADSKIVQIVGVATGKGVSYKNLGVSSTTLKNDSNANQERGITTDGQIQKAIDYNPDYIFINWGTNDSKAGVSTLAEYRTSLIERVDELRTKLPRAVIVLCTFPQGRQGSAYDNNGLYANEMRNVAIEKNLTFVDVTTLFKNNDEGGIYNYDYNIYSDDVHPSVVGYSLWASTVCSKFKIPFYSLAKNTSAVKKGTVVNFPLGGEVKFNASSAIVITPNSSGDVVKEIINGEIVNTGRTECDIYLTAIVRCGATAEIQGDSTLTLELSSDDGVTWFEKDELTLYSDLNANKFTQFTLRCHHNGSLGVYKYRITGKNY